ncbi:MAG: hypothetical protein HYZ57_07680 [Acidobacteria bacterium]|nr:hypothetical protein [Acidobacteriota bacterium]
MRVTPGLLVILVATPRLAGQIRSAGPEYAAGGVVNSASGLPGPLAPNTLATVYGIRLASGAAATASVQKLPTALPNTRARVFLDHIAAGLYYASPNQINFVVPPRLRAGPVELRIETEGVLGPAVRLELAEAAPALFSAEDYALATHADGSLINTDAPAQPGEIVVLYATGLGGLNLRLDDLVAPDSAVRLARLEEFRVLLNGETIDSSLVFYAGVAPGYPGLYQVNVFLPDDPPENPEIRIGYPDQLSPEGIRLYLKLPE